MLKEEILQLLKGNLLMHLVGFFSALRQALKSTDQGLDEGRKIFGYLMQTSIQKKIIILLWHQYLPMLLPLDTYFINYLGTV